MMMMMVMMMMMFIMLTTLGLRAKIVMASMFMMEWICEDFGREMEKKGNTCNICGKGQIQNFLVTLDMNS